MTNQSNQPDSAEVARQPMPKKKGEECAACGGPCSQRILRGVKVSCTECFVKLDTREFMENAARRAQSLAPQQPRCLGEDAVCFGSRLVYAHNFDQLTERCLACGVGTSEFVKPAIEAERKEDRYAEHRALEIRNAYMLKSWQETNELQQAARLRNIAALKREMSEPLSRRKAALERKYGPRDVDVWPKGGDDEP